ncbi:hypothetical protein mvi_53 [Megavirus vitis]|nr:hypothetical protein mvi_53 [Megavirus vitis]
MSKKNNKLDLAFNLNRPGGGPQGPPIKINDDDPIYEEYTGDEICHDVLEKDANYDKSFHVIEHNPIDDSLMEYTFKQHIYIKYYE